MKTVFSSHLVQESPSQVSFLECGTRLIDFGRVAFGNLHLLFPSGIDGELIVHFGEALAQGRVDRNPPGCVRYSCVKIRYEGTGGWRVVAPSADERNTGPKAIALPSEWGVILPFRWVEIEGWPESVLLDASSINRRAAYSANWADDAAAFESSDDMLNRIWELCRYSIKATTFAGIYVDGDRERIPYEADAYLNQISHYACDPHPEMARATFDYLMQAPTWPTEWAAHMVFMAHADWMYTGDISWIAARYESLKTKLLPGRERADGLIASDQEQIKNDLVDWPLVERDAYEFTALNAVVNAFQYRALDLMAALAMALGKSNEASAYEARAAALSTAYQQVFFDPVRGIYRDGEKVEHASLHANLFPLAFGLVPAECQAAIVDYLKNKGMACSVYAAQYLLEALFQSSEGDQALRLILASGNRSWRHMVESGTTITWEAWDQSYKPNQDWNHAWGAAPANLLPRFVLGVTPLEPGYRRVAIRPQLGDLSWARGVVPTVRGPIQIHVRRDNQNKIHLDVNAPAGMEIIS